MNIEKHRYDYRAPQGFFDLIGEFALVLPLATVVGLLATSVALLPFYASGIVTTTFNLDYHLSYASPIIVYPVFLFDLATCNPILAVLGVTATGSAMANYLVRMRQQRDLTPVLKVILTGSWVLFGLILLATFLFSISGWAHV